MKLTMKQLSGEQWAFLAIALAAVGWAGFELTALVTENGGMPNPQKQPLPDDWEAANRIGWHRKADGFSVLCHPDEHHAGYVYTPHRYPRSVGGEVSNAIHHGFSRMRVPNVDDVQWIISPPSEASW